MVKAHFVTLAASIVWAFIAAPGIQRPLPAQSPDEHPRAPIDSSRANGMGGHAMDHAVNQTMSGAMDENMMKHMFLTPARPATHDDTVRAQNVANTLKRAIAKYQDTSAAVADGYQLFLPDLKTQKVYHFTNYGRAFKEALRFDPAQPTSILYGRGDDGKLHLLGAMYTMPKRASLERLDARIPLSIAHWHQHVNWCLPKKGEQARWVESKDGRPVFGPESPIATKSACDAVGGDFHASLLGWMLHANVYAGSDLGAIFADDHAAHEMMDHEHP
jgi:hypothetical protein